MWHKHFDINITIVFVLVAIVNMGYYLMSKADGLEAAVMARKITYLGGCYMIMFLFFIVCSQCGIRLNRWLRTMFFLLSSIVYLSALTIGENGIFYKMVDIEHVGGAVVFNRSYGIMHMVFYILIIAYFVMSIAVMLYSYFTKNQVSRKTIYLLSFTELFAMVSFFGGRKILYNIELIPIAYNMALVIYLIIIYRMCLYNITDTTIDSLIHKGDTGLISFDLRYNYLGSNDAAKRFFPELNELMVDKQVNDNEYMKENAYKWMLDYEKDNSNNTVLYPRNDRIYLVNVSYLYDGRRKRGYHFVITDDTKNQEYITLLDSFNTELREKVNEQTERIVEMHDNLIVSLAMMVESRDNSTGGHIKRTSEGVRIIIDEMKKDPEINLSEDFCRNIIKAAPMHDLGKIAVDDAILRKPGRFTPEEFDKMKVHAAEGARIVREILINTDDDEFRRIAENVAHYHHERVDGSGYPDGLKGDEIPLEARIMAIADVYDALVSKRVYKQSMSFEKADSIIMEGMGTHFDKKLEQYYVKARARLEDYYNFIEC